MKDVRKGSELESEQKMLTVARICMGLATVILFLLWYVFNTQTHDEVILASRWLNIAGVLFFICAGLSCLVSNWINDMSDSNYRFYIVWFVFIGLATLLPIIENV